MGRAGLGELSFQDLAAGGGQEEGLGGLPAAVQCEQRELDSRPLGMRTSHTERDCMHSVKGPRGLYFPVQRRGESKAGWWQCGEAHLCFFNCFPCSTSHSWLPVSFCQILEEKAVFYWEYVV